MSNGGSLSLKYSRYTCPINRTKTLFYQANSTCLSPQSHYHASFQFRLSESSSCAPFGLEFAFFMELKVVCDCGQKYKFDVEPVHGRMPFPINCPICGADGTPLANNLLGQMPPGAAVPTAAHAPAPVA